MEDTDGTWTASDFRLGIPFAVLGGLLVLSAITWIGPASWCMGVPVLLLGALFVLLGANAFVRSSYPLLRRLGWSRPLAVDRNQVLEILRRVERDTLGSDRWQRLTLEELRRGYRVKYHRLDGAAEQVRIFIDGSTGEHRVLRSDQ